MHKYAKLVIVLLIAVSAYLGSIANYQWNASNAYHGPNEINFFRGNNIELPLADNGLFMASGNCDGCHGFDEQQEANVDGELNDISPVTMWRGSMMANSAKDPLWKAKVSHEVAMNPSHQAALEDKCTSCHAPMGRYTKHIFGFGPYSMDDLEIDSIGQDGVSCLACHKQTDEDLGILNSGELNFTSNPVAFGPFEKPFEPPMQDLVGVLPVYSEHITDAGICAGCHTLLTNSVDLQGNFTGETFVEQATYHEWLNSAYNDGESLAETCQECHMPEADVSVLLSSNYSEIFPRSPFRKHELVGGNSFMLKILKANATTLGIAANDEVMDSTIARTERMLQTQTLNAELNFITFNNDSAYFELELENLAGHKFPSGYPARRAFVELLVIEENGDTMFQSGVLQPDFEVAGHNATYEPHYNLITSEDQAQIYEMVMGDVNGDVTTVLERAYQHLKDNRLAPKGFTTSHEAYDTTQIYGLALNDSDFNFDGFEGSGTDVIRYHVNLDGYSGTLKATAKVYYQPVPPRFLQEMFAVSTPEIDAFETMFNNADHTPVLVAADSVMNINVVTGTNELTESRFEVYPNPTKDGFVRVSTKDGEQITLLTVFDVSGKLVDTFNSIPTKGIQLPDDAGIYLIQVDTESGSELIKVVRH